MQPMEQSYDLYCRSLTFHLNAHPSALFQRHLHAGSVLLHHHGVLCTGAAV